MSPLPLVEAPKVEFPTGSPCTPGRMVILSASFTSIQAKWYVWHLGTRSFSKRKINPAKLVFLIHQPPPPTASPVPFTHRTTARKLFHTTPEAWFSSATLMHNLLTYTIPVNSSLAFSCINEFEGFIKIWIQIKELETKSSGFFFLKRSGSCIFYRRWVVLGFSFSFFVRCGGKCH